MDFLIKAAQLILSLSILVVLHELGHFIPARLFGTRVEKFFLFFDLKFALWKKKIGDTVYGIGWIPLGGYVKISGMIDESMDKEQMSKPPEPWEFRAKPAWQRLIIMLGGVTVNLLLGLLIYICILWVWGREYLPLENVTYGVHVSELMKEQGMRDGDRIVAVEGQPRQVLEDVAKAILIDEARTLTVERDGVRQEITLSTDVHEKILDRNEKVLFLPRVPFVVDSMTKKGPARASDLRTGDRIIAVNDVSTPFFGDFRKEIAQHAGTRVMVGVERGSSRVYFPMSVQDDGTIGVYNSPPGEQFTLAREEFGLGASITHGTRYGLSILGSYVNSLKLLGSSSGLKQMGGFGSIGGLFGEWGDWQQFWETTAFLSIILAFMNILPIPALDGGHVMFLLYEVVTRRSPNQKVLEYAQMVGMALLLALILFANGNDVFRWITGRL